MKIKQDDKTGKLLIELENLENQNNFTEVMEDYLDGLADVVSNNIRPELLTLKINQERLISIVTGQQSVITALVKIVTCLANESEEGLSYRLNVITKLAKGLADEFNKLQTTIETK